MRTMLTALAAAAVVSIPAAASAQGYVGAAVGAARINVDCSDLDSCDKTSTGWKAFGGWRVHPNLAVEAVYMDFGKVKASDFDEELDATIRGSAKGRSLGLGVAASADVGGGLSAVARLGFARNRLELSASALGVSESDTTSATRPYFGLGLGYKVTPNVSIDVGFDTTRFRYTDVNDAGEDVRRSATARLLAVGLGMSF